MSWQNIHKAQHTSEVLNQFIHRLKKEGPNNEVVECRCGFNRLNKHKMKPTFAHVSFLLVCVDSGFIFLSQLFNKNYLQLNLFINLIFIYQNL